MKTKIFSYLTMMALAAGVSACSDDTWTPDVDGQGEGTLNTESIVPTVTNAELVITGTQGAKKAPSRATTDISNYLVDVVDASNPEGQPVESWTFSTMPSLPTFAVGSYKVKVRSHEVQKAEWNKPYFLGEQSFQIRNGEITDVEPITCKLANIKVTVEFDSKLVAASANNGADLKLVVTSEPGVSLEFTTENTSDAGYFEATAGLETLKVVFTGTVQGNAESTTAVLTGVAAGQHRKIIMKLKSNQNPSPDEVGNIQVDGEGINVDFSVVEQDLAADIPVEEETLPGGDRPNQEGPDPTTPDDPTPPTPEEDSISLTSETLDLEGVNNADDFGPGVQDAIVNIHSDEGVLHLNVEIISEFLTDDFLAGVGLTTKFDLANADDVVELENGKTLAANLRGLGFNVNDEVVGKNDLVFDITGFMPLLLEAGDHKFKITVTDMKSATKEVTLLVRKS